VVLPDDRRGHHCWLALADVLLPGLQLDMLTAELPEW
jgi:hypothetical protein